MTQPVPRTRAVVLLSGGMDSVAALHGARAYYDEVRAIGFAYGQPHADAELVTAARISGKCGVPFVLVDLGDALRVRAGLLGGVRDHDERRGANAAFVPGRNVAFLTLAAAQAVTWWPTGDIDLVIGACRDDAEGFLDCRPAVLAMTGDVLRLACGRDVWVAAPFAQVTKTEILQRAQRTPGAVEDISRSWSCYRGELTGPCHACTACVQRDRAFHAVGLVDRCTHPLAPYQGDIA